MAVVKLNGDNFEKEVLQAEGKVLVDFFATWCGPCKMMGPVVDNLAEEVKNAKICKLDIDESQQIAGQYGVMSVPTFMVFENGQVVNKSMGVMPKESLVKLLEK
ncbi:MAG: thioredoxin [Eubacteriales bacterium]|jgi:thioredoxin 1|nr:thioredoxin [Eubacteriales bacterium]